MNLKAIYYTCPQGNRLLFTKTVESADKLFDMFNTDLFNAIILHGYRTPNDYLIQVIDTIKVDFSLLTHRCYDGIDFYVYTEDLDKRGYHKKDINRTYNFDLSSYPD